MSALRRVELIGVRLAARVDLEAALEEARDRMYASGRRGSLVEEMAAVEGFREIAAELAHRESVASSARMADRARAAVALAVRRFDDGQGDLEPVEPPTVDSVDAGFWVHVRLFVSADDVEAELAPGARG